MLRIAAGRIEIRVPGIPRPFPKRVQAVTLWPVIFYAEDVWDNECVQVHERYHWADQIRWFLLPWFALYLALTPFYGGGKRHPLEREAYRRQQLCEDAQGQ